MRIVRSQINFVGGSRPRTRSSGDCNSPRLRAVTLAVIASTVPFTEII